MSAAMNKTNIPWVKNPDGSQGFTWNPTTGCTFGCDYCYARVRADRNPKGVSCFMPRSIDAETAQQAHYDLKGPWPWGFHPTLHPERLDEPLRRKKPAVIFLGSMGDVFDPAIPDEFRDRIFSTVAEVPRHTFVVLTKRPENMRRYFSEEGLSTRIWTAHGGYAPSWVSWPIANLVLGVSVTNQADADERIPLLLDTPTARRMVSVEPMLGPVDLEHVADPAFGPYWSELLDFVAVGGKTPGKPLHDDDALILDEEGCFTYSAPHLRDLRDQCLAAGVPFHYKAGGTNPALDGVVHDAEVPR